MEVLHETLGNNTALPVYFLPGNHDIDDAPDNTTLEYRLKGLTETHKAEVAKFRDFLERESNKRYGDREWPEDQILRWGWTDKWDKRRIK